MNWFNKFWKRSEGSEGEREDSRDVLNDFSPRAQEVLNLARKEADRFNHSFVGTEHLLLGLIRLGQGTAVTVLGKMGLTLERVRLEVEKNVGVGPEKLLVNISIPYTPRVKTVLGLAAKEAKQLHHTYVGTEHILLGLLREGEGVAARVLFSLGVDLEQTRHEILRVLDPNSAMATKATAMPQNAASSNTPGYSVDIAKRYDVYCMEPNQQVVYRNALFKGAKKLFPKRAVEVPPEFIELEQPDGKTIFVERHSVLKFCEHGETPGSEPLSGNRP